MTLRYRLLVLLVSTPLVLFTVLGGYLGRTLAQEETYQHLRIFEDVVSLILNNYVEDIDVDQVMSGAMQGLSAGLDPDSAYLTTDEVRELEDGAAIPEGQVGLTLSRQFYLRVVAARDGSPAALAGLRPGDYVRAIGGRPTREMSVFRGSRLLRGEPGSTVRLTILRGNAADPQVIELTRTRRVAPTATHRMVADGMGYLRVVAFDEDVADRIRAHVESLVGDGAERLILDLRNTAEGELESGVDAARLFVGAGTVAVLDARDAETETILARSDDGEIAMPLTVLINRGTAGAAELVASAIAHNDRGDLIGTRTTGRVALQRLVGLPDGSGLWLSWARYRSADGEPLHEQGLEPDVPVAEPEFELGEPAPAVDPILERALEHLRAPAND